VRRCCRLPWKMAKLSEDDNLDEDRRLKERLPIIKCECGAEILLLPDLKVMSHAVEVHVEEHRKTEKDAVKAATDAVRVRNNLIAQVLDKASESKK
jgi:hypothetical protein